MKVWLIKVGEPSPSNDRNERLHRMGLLAERLVKAGHSVTWWSSTFDHAAKRHLAADKREIWLSDNLLIIQLHARPYSRNISIARLLNHREEAALFAKEASARIRPDVIVCAYPTIDLSRAAVNYGRRNCVPVVIDVRDLWPDIFAEAMPTVLRRPVRFALSALLQGKKYAFRNASAIVGTSQSFVNWGVKAAKRKATPLDVAFPHGYPVASLNADQRRKALDFWQDRLGAPLPKNIVCFFGNFSQHVLDLDTVIRAARVLEEMGNDIDFVLCGTGPMLPSISEKVRSLRTVHLPGRVNAAQIKVLMENSKAGLLPYQSRWDFVQNVPNKAIEYMSEGLPVITCLDGEVASLIRNYGCGKLYRNRDAESLVTVIGDLVADAEKRNSQAKAALHLFNSAFQAETVYGRYVAHLEQLEKISSIP